MDIQIKNMRRTHTEEVVVEISWKATKKSGSVSAAINRTSKLSYLSPSSPGFIPFEDLTEDQVKQWIIDDCGAEVEKLLDEQLLAKGTDDRLDGYPSAWLSIEGDTNA